MTDHHGGTPSPQHVCVVGTGPAGMVLALELAKRGCTVTLVESGVEMPHPKAQSLSDAPLDVAGTHAPMDDAVQRRFGGTSNLWGGRCVPLDPIDFEPRPGLRDVGWPIRFEDLAVHYPLACQYADCGEATFTTRAAWAGAPPPPPLSEGFDDGDVVSDRLERWSRVSALVERLGPMLRSQPRIRLLLGQTCTDVKVGDAGGHVTGLTLVDTLSGVPQPFLSANAYVLACGGVETTRLLLHFAGRPQPLRIEGRAWLGQGYMGHLSGKIASIRLSGDPRKTRYEFERVAGHYVRRRLVLSDALLRSAGLLNIAMWLDNPPPAESAHGSGILSAAYLAMRMPLLGRRLAPSAIRKSLLRGQRRNELFEHLANIVRSLPSTLSFVARFLYARYYATPRLPGFFAYSPANLYALHFHAEHASSARSTITLDAATDALGVPRARLALRFGAADADSVVAAHAALDGYLRAHGLGQLEYWYAEDERAPAVLDQSLDGFHQIGTTRMAAGPDSGVTDSFGRVFGVDNLYVCSSSVFPTSGQANPTLSILAFAIRQAEYLTRDAAGPA
jgi:hypothetical protein